MTASPAVLLSSIADALNELHALGVRPILRHGAVITDHGYVLPGPDGWDVRMKIGDPQLVACGDPDDD